GQFITLKNGLHAMTMALEKKLNSIIQTNEAVKSLVKQDETNILTTESGEKFEADMDVSTTSFPKMQALLPDDSFIPAQSIEQSSVANIALQYNRQDLKELPEGTGFVVASSSGLDMTACTWLHKKWPHTTPKNKLLLRTFIGRPHNQALLNLTDKQLIE